jgi:hypothetical protein
MAKPPRKPTNMSQEFYAACIAITAKRPQTVIHHILKHGFITTEELTELYGYDHPPRAAGDVKDNGIPIETFRVTSKKTGRQIGAYRFSDPTKMVAGRVGGRKAFSKQFKQKLLDKYGARSALTNEPLETRYLQIDHRIPYAVAGNTSGETIEDYMLLDASAQRAKSWSCEHCKNFLEIKDANICRTCFWAFPENYTHVAMREERRLDLVWSGRDVEGYINLLAKAKDAGKTPQEIIKQIIAVYLSGNK